MPEHIIYRCNTWPDGVQHSENRTTAEVWRAAGHDVSEFLERPEPDASAKRLAERALHALQVGGCTDLDLRSDLITFIARQGGQ